MISKMGGIVEGVLASVSKEISNRVCSDDINLVNDYLPESYKLHELLKEDGLEHKSIRRLDEDEVGLFCYLFLEENAMPPKAKYLQKLNLSHLAILKEAMFNHFLRLLNSKYIQERVLSFGITKGFWLIAILQAEKTSEEKLEELTREGLSVFLESIQALNRIDYLWIELGVLKALEKDVPLEDKSINPFVFKKDVVDCIQEVYGTGGTLIATKNGWLPMKKSGEFYREYLSPIPYSDRNDKIVLTFFPNLKR